MLEWRYFPVCGRLVGIQIDPLNCKDMIARIKLIETLRDTHRGCRRCKLAGWEDGQFNVVTRMVVTKEKYKCGYSEDIESDIAAFLNSCNH